MLSGEVKVFVLVLAIAPVVVVVVLTVFVTTGGSGTVVVVELTGVVNAVVELAEVVVEDVAVSVDCTVVETVGVA